MIEFSLKIDENGRYRSCLLVFEIVWLESCYEAVVKGLDWCQVGHALQHLMTESPYSEVAGLNNLEWDATQVSAQFLQFW
jgi:Peptidase family M3